MSKCSGGYYEEETQYLKSWEHFRDWVHCICVVTFDLELGQAMEAIFPPDTYLVEEDKMNICYLAFPDSNSSCIGDTQFHFRIRQSLGISELSKSQLTYNEECPVFLKISPNYFFGYVYFRQIKDPTISRGYFQKSLVIVSKLPFVRLFNQICGIIAPEFFDSGERSIEVASHEINQWPPLSAGQSLTLPLFGEIVHVHIPREANMAALSLNSSCSSTSSFSISTSFPSICDLNTYTSFSQVIYHVHVLWELVLTAEPLVVMASSPGLCSRLVQSLVSMISPLQYNADYRPYFTIHDTEFREFMTKAHSPPNVILGVTNPYFEKTMQHWPHVIRISEAENDGVAKHTFKRNSTSSLFDGKTGVYTHYKAFLHKDKNVIKKLIKGRQSKRPSEIQSAILRRHLLELTQSFIIPLERYMATLMPLHKNISPFKSSPNPLPFNADDFLSSLEVSGPHLTTTIKGDWEGLYRKFFRSPNFNGWYDNRFDSMKKKLTLLHIEVLSHANMQEWLEGKKEVEIIDMILKLQELLREIKMENIPLNDITEIQVNNRLKDLIQNLPDDLKTVVNFNNLSD